MSKNQSRGSLGGQNSDRRISSARSSRALSTNFKKLRELDRKISEIDNNWKPYFDAGCHFYIPEKIRNRRIRLDNKRKEIRLKRKGYTNV